MLINCPRCGFQQPKDKYCAQCGVDMETFKPATPPAWKRLLGNPLLQLSFLVIIAGGVGVTLYQKGQQTFERRAGQLKSTVQINSSSQAPAQALAEVEQNFETPTNEQAGDTANSANEDGSLTAYKVSPPNPTSTSAAADAKALAKSGAPHLVVYYAEVSRTSLSGISSTSRGVGQFMEFNDYSAGIIPSIGKALAAPQVKILHKEVRPVGEGKTLQWFYGVKDSRDPAINIGLTTFFEISDIDNGNLRGNLEIQRTWREPVASGGFEIQKKSFPAIFEIGGETGFFLSGIMPLRSYLENDTELSAIEVYKILSSPQFRSGESSFVIFIEFKTDN